MKNMRRGIIIGAVLTALLAAAGALYLMSGRPVQNKEINLNSSGNMRIHSPSFEQNNPIPGRFTCDGENINPKLVISGVPAKAISLALIMDDPDAPFGDWVHWVIWNIPASQTEIAENSIPAGAVQGVTSFGKPGYGGPCPPSGQHRYFFRMYALDDTLDLPDDTTADELERAMEGHILDKAGLLGVYGR
jgi:Raf kinase inhibitor-like YbhB/YbcL family protein